MKASIRDKEDQGECRILYVEDDTPSQNLLQRATRHRKGWKLYLANSLQQARDLLVFKPHVILLDIHLPDGSGYDFLDYLKSEPEYAGIPVIAVSANAMHEQVARGIDAGMRHYLTKPLNLRELYSVIDALHPTEIP